MIAAATADVSATTYYVSPTGDDFNGGTSAMSPWASVAKVNSTNFAPGDSILFQYGGTWNASLTATSSGTATAPITYGAYGTPSAGLPTFSGSDPVANNSLTSVVSSPAIGYTYSAPVTTQVNWVFDNHAFMTNSAVATGATDSGTDVGYVESNAGSFYYDPIRSKVYVNTGTPASSGHTLSFATRDDAVLTSGHGNLVFRNLRTTETAKLDAGYGFRVQNADNVTIQASVADDAGKHSFGVIDSTGFTGSNLTANQNMPGLGFGGATGFVVYTDNNRAGTTAVWNDLTYNNSQGAYSAFYSHGDANGIGSITINGLTSLNGYGSGIGVESTGPNERTVVNGARLGGGAVVVNTDHAILSGMSVTDNGYIQVSGVGSVVQNSLFTGLVPNVFNSNSGAVVDAGLGTTIRYNTFSFPSNFGPAVGIRNAGSGSKVYGNVFDTPQEIGLQDTTTPNLQSDYNYYSYAGYPNYGPTFAVGVVANTTYYSLAGWQALGFDAHSVLTPNAFVNPDDGDLASLPVSLGLGLASGDFAPPQFAANAMLDPADADGRLDAGPFVHASVPEPATTGVAAFAGLLVYRSRQRPERAGRLATGN